MDCCLLPVNQPLSNKALILEANRQISSPSSSSNIVYVKSVSIALYSDVFVGFITCTSSSLSSSLPHSSSSSFLVNCSIISSSVKRDSVQTKPSSTFDKLFEVNSDARSSFRARKLSISSVSALKGSSSSLIAATCWSFDIPAFEKQLMIVSSVTLFQAKTNIFSSYTLIHWLCVGSCVWW